MNSVIDAMEYRETMQRAALAYLKRHHKEHLDHDDQLFSRTITHLRLALGVSEHLAESLAGLAYSELHDTADERMLDVSRSTGATAVLTDPLTGNVYTLPVALIFQHLIDGRALPRSAL